MGDDRFDGELPGLLLHQSVLRAYVLIFYMFSQLCVPIFFQPCLFTLILLPTLVRDLSVSTSSYPASPASAAAATTAPTSAYMGSLEDKDLTGFILKPVGEIDL